MDKLKLIKLIKDIQNCEYPIDVIESKNIYSKLKSRLKTSKKEALALLGYLQKGNHIKIDREMGIVLDPSSEELRKIITKI